MKRDKRKVVAGVGMRPVWPDSIWFHTERVVASQLMAIGHGVPIVNGLVANAFRYADQLFASQVKMSLACRKGCSHCCHLPVAASAAEAFHIADALHRMWPADLVAAVRERISDFDDRTRHLTIPERARAKIPCAMLGSNGACTVYPIRPLLCRAWHSRNVEPCKRAFEQAADVPVPMTEYRDTASSTWAGLCIGLKDQGLDWRPVKLMTAVRAALEDPDLFRRWCQGERLLEGLVNQETATRSFSHDAGTLADSRLWLECSSRAA